LLWRFIDHGTAAGHGTSPSVDANGTVYVYDMFTVYALNGSTGTKSWKYNVDFDDQTLYGGFSIAIGFNGTVYFGTSPGYYQSKGSLYALNSTGGLRWRIKNAPAYGQSSAALRPMEQFTSVALMDLYWA